MFQNFVMLQFVTVKKIKYLPLQKTIIHSFIEREIAVLHIE